jgi:hypothetical protein
MALTARGATPTSVFRLLGADENSATFALGWVLEQSAVFRDFVIAAIFKRQVDARDAVITLQTHAADGGFTDLELQAGRRFHVIVEAKRSWELPTMRQLSRYQPRLVTAGAALQRLVSVSAMTADHARRHLPRDIGGVELAHLSWRDLQRAAEKSHYLVTGFEERLWLRQLIEHLREFVAMYRLTNNLVYVVSLGTQPMVDGQSHTWIDVVAKDRCYFHPIGAGWPAQPPNYMGFRYHGRLQSVHHVDSFDVVTNLAAFNKSWIDTESDHFVYRLGPPMTPASEVRTGNIFRNGRVWCAIDTLLSGAFHTISDARDETKRRLAEPA